MKKILSLAVIPAKAFANGEQAPKVSGSPPSRGRLLFFIAMLSLAALCRAETKDPISEFPQRVKKFALKNGMRVLVFERPTSQTVAFSIYIRTGGMDDETGKSGLAHMFEHMLFKGTKTIGTKDYAKEAPILDQIDKLQAALTVETDKAKAEEFARQLAELNKKHESLLEPEEFWRIYERAGGRGLNAATGYDFTNYTVSLPLNAVKLWFTMEADRIKNPVLREFYKERSVVMEERRQRIDTSPQGKLWEVFLAAAFEAHPYGRPIVGWESDITRVTRADAIDFFKRHYDVSRLVVSVVGGVKADEIEALCKTYFEPIPSAPSGVEQCISVEPRQEGERRVQVEFDAEPALLMGYHRPDQNSPDDAALSVLEDVLSTGRTSRFNKEIIEKSRIGVSAWASASGPGERDPNLFVIGGSPRAPHTTAELEAAVLAQIELIKKTPPTAAEIEKVKNTMESAVIRGLASNEGMASQLGYNEAVAGDWKKLLMSIEDIRKVTPADVQRVATVYLTPSNRTTAVLVRKK